VSIIKMDYLLILPAIAAGAVLVSFLRCRSPGSIAALKRRYRQLMSLSEQQAEKSLQYQLKAVRKRYPGRSEQWYLEKIIYNLERDRR
jgi:hypothetical protein